MRIILNSDILYTQRPLMTGLPAHLDRFCREAASAGAFLVVPRTTLLEIERNERHSVEEAITKISNAVTVLDSWGINLEGLDPRQLVRPGDVIEALRATGIVVEVEEPSLNDYREAERKACLHLPPRPPETESDEMRDLIIWVTALRLARKDGQAILVSRDEIHTHERGGAEAEEHGLLRARTLDEALDLTNDSCLSNVLIGYALLREGDMRPQGSP